MDEDRLSEHAISFVKDNVKEFIGEFSDDRKYPPTDKPVSVFMAGSPGAGKTEFSKRLLDMLEKRGVPKSVRIDGDEIRENLPGYSGSNAYLFQGAVALAVNKIHDYVLQKNKSFLLDSTFTGGNSLSNVERSLKKGRVVEIDYIFQEPQRAWEIVLQREKVEGRAVPKDIFIEQMIKAREMVQQSITTFGSDVSVNVLVRNYKNSKLDLFTDVTDLSKVIPMNYSKEELEKLL
jgi:UDP-N-acetylglucosamine kinase